MKKRKIFICIFSAAVLINVVPLLIFKDKAALSNYWYYQAILMILVSIKGVLAFFLRHKGNCLGDYRRPVTARFFSEDKDYTFTEEYEKEFFWQFCIYWFAIPFYIPCIFFVSGPWGSILWTMCVFFGPLLVYIIYGISCTLKDVKEYRTIQKNRDQELKEQERREEMGRFK